MVAPATKKGTCRDGVHDWYFSRYCGADVCDRCGAHAHLRKDGTVMQELARCYCGYGLGRGERLEDDVDE
jgi:hypothetical protein